MRRVPILSTKLLVTSLNMPAHFERYKSLKEIERDVASFGFKFKQITTYPTVPEALVRFKQSDTVHWIKWDNVPDEIQGCPLREHLISGFRGKPDVLLIFGFTSFPIAFSGIGTDAILTTKCSLYCFS